MTRDLYNLNLFVKLIVLHCQFLFNLVLVEAVLMPIYAEHGVAPGYLKLVTSSNLWPFMH